MSTDLERFIAESMADPEFARAYEAAKQRSAARRAAEAPRRRRFRVALGHGADSYDRPYSYHYEVDDPDGPLMSSQVVGAKTHMPVFDIDDAPFNVQPSRTPGHRHLFVDRVVTWRQYRRAIKALAAIGVVDPEWARASIKRKHGVVRVQARP